MLEFFENQDACPLADDKTVAVLIPWTASLFRIIVAGGKGAHRSKSANAHSSDGSFGSAGDHHIGIAVLDNAERVTDRMSTRRAGSRRRFIGSLGTVAHGDLSGGKVNDG